MVSISESPQIPVWLNRDGTEEPLAVPPRQYGNPHIYHDGTRIAFEISSPQAGNEIYIWDLTRENMMRLTFDEANDFVPLWSQDGQRVVFGSRRGEGYGGVFSKKADYTGNAEELYSLTVPGQFAPWSLSSDGNTVLLSELTLTPLDVNIGTLSLDEDHQRKGLLQEKYMEAEPQISPNGKWMAYTSNESGQTRIYVRPFPDIDSGGQSQVSTNGGHSPRWSPDGRELFYRNGDATMVVPVETDPTFSPGNPEILFQGTYFTQDIFSQLLFTTWDIHPDGDRFLMIKPSAVTEEGASEEPRKINIVLNWFEELKDRVQVN